jgi:hypothetical protein
VAVDHFGLLESGSTLDLGHILPMNPTARREMTEERFGNSL